MPTNEPVAVLGAVPILVTAVLALLVAFGVSLNDAQTAALLGVTSAVIAVVTALQRNRVYPAGKVEEIISAESVIHRAALTPPAPADDSEDRRLYAGDGRPYVDGDDGIPWGSFPGETAEVAPERRARPLRASAKPSAGSA